ncbi:MAG: hypothetical protein JXR83_20530 [Deltaproteobacteria bacterium]|nr:hypothetical protein [Deltaproteobacteria bacterium]
MASVKRPYGPWSCSMLAELRRHRLLKVDAFVSWLAERGIEVDRTLVSHWIAGRSHLPADLLPLLAEFTGQPEQVFDAFVHPASCELVHVPRGVKGDRELTELLLAVGAAFGHLQHLAVMARAPASPGGVQITAEERSELLDHLQSLIQQLIDLKAQLASETSGRSAAALRAAQEEPHG